MANTGCGRRLSALPTAKIEIVLGTVKQHDFSLAPIKNTEQRIIEMPGDFNSAGLPGDTRDDLRMKQIFRNNRTSCHTPSYTLQHASTKPAGTLSLAP